MASTTAFCDMMGQFLLELSKTFPEEKGIKKFMTSFDLIKGTNPRKVVEAYMAGVTPYADKISQKDESFFLESMQEIDYLKDLNIKDHWNDKLSVNTKNAIWQYLQTLYMLGVTITSIPQETLGAIEKLAEDAATKLGGENMDQDALMQTMSNMLGGMLKK